MLVLVIARVVLSQYCRSTTVTFVHRKTLPFASVLLCDVTNAVCTSMAPGVDETLYSLLRSLKKGEIENVINWPVNRPDAARLVLPVNRPAGDSKVQVTHWQLSIYKTTTRANTTCH